MIDENKNIQQNNKENILKTNDIIELKEDIENVFKEEKSETENSKKIIAKILKSLRENKHNLLLSIFQEFEYCKIEGNLLEIGFNSNNFEEILSKQDNILIINDIIKEDNLKIKYNFNKQKEEKNIEDILKEKFNKINIKE